MAPSNTMQKVLKEARKRQQAFGPRAWASPFPHDMLRQDKSRATNIIKVRSQPAKSLMNLDTICKKFDQSTTILQDQSTLPKCQSPHKPVMAQREAAEQSNTTDAQDIQVVPAPKPVPECTPQDKSDMPPCIAHGQDSVASTNIVTKVTTKPAVAKRTIRRVGKPMTAFKPLRRDSLSPTNTTAAVAPKGHKGNASRPVSPQGIKGSSSSPTSAKGVHLLLAVIPLDHFDLWIEDWKTFCTLSDDHVSALCSSIEKRLDSAGLQVYADCDNKTVAELLKNKVTGEEVFGKQLICRYI